MREYGPCDGYVGPFESGVGRLLLRREPGGVSSRRSLPSKVPGHTVTCGWDNPLQTYFCTVIRERVAKER